MNEICRQMLELISVSIGTKANYECEGEVNWDELYHLSSIHNLLPLMFDGIMKEGLKINPPELYELWKRKAMSQSIGQVQHTVQFLELYEKLKDAGIKAIVVKGAVLRNIYPNPYNRISGDEDIYISKKDFDSVDAIFNEYGFFSDKSKKASDDLKQEIIYQNLFGQIIEVHTELFDSDVDLYEKNNTFFLDAFENAILVQIESTKVHTLPHEKHFLFLVLHSIKHFVNNGCGIRQLCDIVMYCNCYGKEMNWDIIWKNVRSSGGAVYLYNLLDIGSKYLGLNIDNVWIPRDMMHYDAHSDALLDDIISAGIFGASDIDREKSSSVTFQALMKDRENSVKQGKDLNFIQMLFPKYQYMLLHYDYCGKSPILLPVAWLHRIVYNAQTLLRRGKVFSRTSRSYVIGTQRVKLLREYGLIGTRINGSMED